MELLISRYFTYFLEGFSSVDISPEEKSSDLYKHFFRNFDVQLDIKFRSFRINGGYETSYFHVDSRERNRSLYETYITILLEEFSYRQIAEEIEPTKYVREKARLFSDNLSRKIEEGNKRSEEIISFYEKKRNNIDMNTSLSEEQKRAAHFELDELLRDECD